MMDANTSKTAQQSRDEFEAKVKDLPYRDLQLKCKEAGLRANGGKGELQGRIMDHYDACVEESNETRLSEMTFVFAGVVFAVKAGNENAKKNATTTPQGKKPAGVGAGLSPRTLFDLHCDTLREHCKKLGISPKGKADDLRRRLCERVGWNYYDLHYKHDPHDDQPVDMSQPLTALKPKLRSLDAAQLRDCLGYEKVQKGRTAVIEEIERLLNNVEVDKLAGTMRKLDLSPAASPAASKSQQKATSDGGAQGGGGGAVLDPNSLLAR
eukprot:INCI18041.2.p2 GENE.INCI18041.2~~INCI18041.2.p2  ORF type:complete len:267 (-),score=56.49 INCI18041.2:1324-2124(-)